MDIEYLFFLFSRKIVNYLDFKSTINILSCNKNIYNYITNNVDKHKIINKLINNINFKKINIKLHDIYIETDIKCEYINFFKNAIRIFIPVNNISIHPHLNF